MPEDLRETYYHRRLSEAGPRYEGFELLVCETALSFAFTYDLFHQLTTRYMGAFGLSRSAFNVLLLLRHGPPEGMQLHDLGKLLLVSRANVTGLIDHLQGKGYVTRIVDSQDRRARYARITAKAEALLDEFVPVHYRNLKVLLQDLTTEEKKGLIQLLKKVRTSFSAHSAHCGAPELAEYGALRQ